MALSKSCVNSVAQNAEFEEDDAKVPKVTVSFLSWELILRRNWLKDDGVKLDAFDSPRQQIEGPMKPHHLR